MEAEEGDEVRVGAERERVCAGVLLVLDADAREEPALLAENGGRCGRGEVAAPADLAVLGVPSAVLEVLVEVAVDVA